MENNTDGEENNSTLTEDVDETDETEAEKQKTTEVEAAEKTEDRKKSGNVKIDDVWEYYTTDLDYDLDEVAGRLLSGRAHLERSWIRWQKSVMTAWNRHL